MLQGITAEAVEEIEALRAIYGDDVSVQPGDRLGLHYPVCITIACKPNTGGNEGQIFVQVHEMQQSMPLEMRELTFGVLDVFAAGGFVYLFVGRVPRCST